MHPAHGAGVVVDRQKKELVDGFRRYYVIEFLAQKLRLYIPEERSREIGMRSIMGDSKRKQVYETLRALPQKLPKHFRTRKKELEDLIFSGAPTKVARALRELTWRKEVRDLSQTDARLLSQARERLVNELAMVQDREPRQVEKRINAALAQAIEAKEEEMQAAA